MSVAGKELSDHAAPEEVVRNYTSLVQAVAWNFRWALSTTLEFSDLVSEGIVGLLRAYRSFDPSRSVKFVTHAMPLIKWEIQKHIREREQVVHVSREVYNLAGLIIKSGMRDWSAEDISRVLSRNLMQVHRALEFLKIRVLHSGESANRNFTEHTIQDRFSSEDDNSNVVMNEIMQSLSSVERCFAQMRMEGYSLTEICESLELTPKVLSRIQAKTRESVSRYMGEELSPFMVGPSPLTKEKYLHMKNLDVDDQTVRGMYRLPRATLLKLKDSWGLIRKAPDESAAGQTKATS
jgi:RNA polymerase sigma factor (sigma-70 family)